MKRGAYWKARQEFDVAYWTSLLKECNGSINRVAIVSGCNRTWLYKKLLDLGVHNTYRSLRRAQWEGNWGELTH
jgi:DNA-binding NtrC family response regulator